MDNNSGIMTQKIGHSQQRYEYAFFDAIRLEHFMDYTNSITNSSWMIIGILYDIVWDTASQRDMIVEIFPT